jgi:hypothetical protein
MRRGKRPPCSPVSDRSGTPQPSPLQQKEHRFRGRGADHHAQQRSLVDPSEHVGDRHVSVDHAGAGLAAAIARNDACLGMARSTKLQSGSQPGGRSRQAGDGGSRYSQHHGRRQRQRVDVEGTAGGIAENQWMRAPVGKKSLAIPAVRREQAIETMSAAFPSCRCRGRAAITGSHPLVAPGPGAPRRGRCGIGGHGIADLLESMLCEPPGTSWAQNHQLPA